MSHSHDVIRLLKQEISTLDTRARLAEALRDRAANDDDRRHQEEARSDFLLKAERLRKSLELIRNGLPLTDD